MNAARRWIPPVTTLVVLVALWEAWVALFHPKSYILPSPVAVAKALGNDHSLILTAARSTLVNTLIGFGLSVVVGLLIAMAVTYSQWVQRAVYPLLVTSQTIPKIAVAPLFVVWLGYGSSPKILNAFLIAFFPIALSAVVGFESASPEMGRLVRSMGASEMQLFRKVRFPNAMPAIFGGLKMGITLAIVGTIVGEFVGSNSGLGYLLLVASGQLNTALVFAAIVVLTFMGIVLFYIVEFAEQLLTRWHVRGRMDDVVVATA